MAEKSVYQRKAEAKRRAEGGTAEVKAERTEAEHESMMAKEKYDPAMQHKGMSQAEVQAAGGLGAYAAAQAAKKKKPTAGDAGKALAERKKKKAEGGYQ